MLLHLQASSNFMSFQRQCIIRAACLAFFTLLTLSSYSKKAEAMMTFLASSTSTSPIALTPSSRSPRSSTATSGPGVKPQGTNCPANAPVKGNISRRGKIYHLPSTRNYNQVKPEACFPSATAAQQAGYRAPKQQR